MYAIKSYIKYLYYSKSKYRIHSPFIFEFITKILEHKKFKSNRIDKLKDFYKINSTNILNEDLGAGSRFEKQKKSKKNTNEWLKKSSSSSKYGKLLNRIANYYNTKKILELGTNLGIGAAYLSTEKNKVLSIEGNKFLAAYTREALLKNNFKNIEIEIGNFDIVLSDILQKNQQFDLYFLDGNHSKKATLSYFNDILSFITPNDIIILDDINWSEEMNEAWQQIYKNQKVKLSIDLYKMGILFFREEQLAKEHHILWH